jgi:uncharacterized protein YndB with AHSA1/START domain
MIRFVTSVHINRPPDIVDQAYVDPENMPYWTKDLEKFEPIKGHIGEAGALALLHFRKKGRTYIMEDELLETEPGKRYKSRVTGGGITAEVETVFETADEGTLITLKWAGKSKAAPFNLLLYLLRIKIKREATSELIEFKNLVETCGIKFS